MVVFYLDAFKLSDNPGKALEKVWHTLNLHGSIIYAKKNKGCPPTITINSVDRLAKDDRELFKTTISLAKDSVNLQKHNVVFVSSEGHVLPMLEE